MHILQISRDEALLSGAPAHDEPLQRQLRYVEILRAAAPDSRMTILVLTSSSNAATAFADDRLRVAAVRGLLRGRIALAWAIIREHRRRRIDVMTTQTVYDEAWLALLLGRLLHIRVIGQVHFDLFSPAAQRDSIGVTRIARVRMALLFRWLKYFSGLRCVAETTAAELRRRMPHKSVRCIPVPVDMVRTAAVDPRTQRRRSVLFVGRLAPEKNLYRWLDTAAALSRRAPGVTFDIVGAGPMQSGLMAYAAQLDVAPRVRFHGALAHGRLRSLYASSSLLLMTSTHEGFGRVVVEAAAHSTPTVATATTGFNEIIDDGRTGILMSSEDPEQIATAAHRVLDDPVMRRAFGEAARERVQARYAPEDLARQWVNYLLDIGTREPGWLLRPRARTLARWWQVACSGLTILRALQYEAIAGLELPGHTLDIGGGEKTTYNHLLRLNGRMTSVNLTSGIRPSVQADANHGLPFGNDVFDHVISLNTFEHVRYDERILADAVRVLKKGGALHIAVPFLYQVHASPSDYNRRTCFWWHETLMGLGIDEKALVIEPLVWDRLSSAYSFIGHGRIGVFLKRLVMLAAVARDFLRRESGRMRSGPDASSAMAVPLGYYIRATK